MPSKTRLKRISDRIQQELAAMIIRRVGDSRLSGITITAVNVDRELSFADIYVSAIEGVSRSKEVLEGLHHASGFLRHELAAVIELRVFPQLRFHWDPTPENADRIERLLDEIRTAPADQTAEQTHNDDATNPSNGSEVDTADEENKASD
jgi:ribosome-binding factor A